MPSKLILNLFSHPVLWRHEKVLMYEVLTKSPTVKPKSPPNFGLILTKPNLTMQCFMSYIWGRLLRPLRDIFLSFVLFSRRPVTDGSW